MLYLVSFLTMLVSLLIYMMDPVPSSLRREEDTAGAEAYIVGFVNQHQAARDFLYQWLGRIYPNNSSKAEVLPSEWAAKAVALPGEELEGLLPITVLDKTKSPAESVMGDFVSERHVYGNTAEAQNIGRLKFGADDTVGVAGSYLSALVCLDSANNLAQCYKYTCDGGTGKTTCVNSPTKVSFRNVVPYVITYSDVLSPEWWATKSGARSMRYEMWRRAIYNRTHASQNCGALSYNSTTNSFCLSNGQRCMRTVPKGIISFLGDETYVGLKKRYNTYVDTGAAEDDPKNLEGVLLCMTEVTNPYDKIARPSRHYDGVDHRALGGGIDTSTDIHEWRPVEGSNVIGVTSFGGEIGANPIGKQYAIIAGDADQSGRELFSIPGQDFTISFITNVGKSYSPTGWWLALCETRDCANPVLGLHQDGNVLFLKVGRDMTPIQLTGDADEGDVIVGGEEISFYDYMEQGVHAWTLVAREGKLLLYVDGWRICTAAGDSGFSTRYPYPTYYVRVAKLPSDSQMGIGSIRYYNKALNGEEIKRNFKVDRRRYAIPSVSSKDSNLCLIEREY